MQIYHENRIKIAGFRDYELSDMGNVYIKGTNVTMVPLVLNGVKTYKNKHDKYLIVAKDRKGYWYYSTAQYKTGIQTEPKRLSLDTTKMLHATITLKWIEHVKYFSNNSNGLKEAEKWADDLTTLYYPLRNDLIN